MTAAGKTGVPGFWPPELLKKLGSIASPGRIWVAFSGGVDSVVLLHAAAEIFPGRLHAVHVNHQLQSNANDMAQFCRQTCVRLNVPVEIQRVDIRGGMSGSDVSSIEEDARNARYRVFEELLEAGDCLLMAHHGNDQLETSFFRFVRGSGPRGLAGMPEQRRLGRGELFRPMLGLSRSHIERVAQKRGLRWVDDPSNTDERFDRNFLRQFVIPLVQQRWPDLLSRVSATREACADSAYLADRLADIHLASCRVSQWSLALKELEKLDEAEQRNLIRRWLELNDQRVPSLKHWSSQFDSLLDADEDRQPEIRGDGFSLRRFDGRLWLVIEPPSVPVHWQQGLPLIPGKAVRWGQFTINLSVTGDASVIPEMKVRGRQSGDRVRSRLSGPSKPFKKWCQERRIPPWEREYLPLIVRVQADGDEQLVAVGDYWQDSTFDGRDWALSVSRESD